MAVARKLRRRDRLRLWYAFLGPPAIWSLHFLIVYAYEEAACSNRTGVSLVEPLVVGATLVLGAAVLAAAVAGYLLWQAVRRDELADPRGRVAFMSGVGALWSGLFLLIMVLSAIQLVAFDPCRPG